MRVRTSQPCKLLASNDKREMGCTQRAHRKIKEGNWPWWQRQRERNFHFLQISLVEEAMTSFWSPTILAGLHLPPADTTRRIGRRVSSFFLLYVSPVPYFHFCWYRWGLLALFFPMISSTFVVYVGFKNLLWIVCGKTWPQFMTDVLMWCVPCPHRFVPELSKHSLSGDRSLGFFRIDA